MGRGPARQQPTCNYPARPITNIFVLTGNISGRGRGQEQNGRGERPQGPKGGGEEQIRGEAESEGWIEEIEDALDAKSEE